MSTEQIFTLNAGSSSLKFGIYLEHDTQEEIALDALVEGIGEKTGRWTVKSAEGSVLQSGSEVFSSHVEALEFLARWVSENTEHQPGVIGHRIVHGGPRLVEHQLITAEVIDQLRSCVHFAPLHIPVALKLVEKMGQIFPRIGQIACFDTAFHASMPELASRLPLPAPLCDEGLRHFGFHGLSYESIVVQLGKAIPARTVVAHLGSGASLAALQEGHSVDTTMGFTPTGGIPMSTRSGDLDPGVILYLLRVKKMDALAIETVLNQESGLKALSGGIKNMQELEAAMDSGDEKARLAIDVFCMAVRKEVSAYAAVLGGIDLLVFTGGIGQNSEPIRQRICQGLEFLGIGKTTPVRIIPSQEDLQIARHSRAIKGRISFE